MREVWFITMLIASGELAPLERAKSALDDFRPKDALEILEAARGAGPYRIHEHTRLFELSGIAHAYLDRADEAVAAFERMLAIDPTHTLSYTLSPKVTFLFERARENAKRMQRTNLDVTWPRNLTTDDAVQLSIEVLADPHDWLHRAALYWRVRTDADYRRVDLKLPGLGEVERINLGPIAATAREDQIVEIYLAAFDRDGNEVFLWASPIWPRDITLRHEAPRPWYGEWWFWLAAGVVVAAGTGTAVYLGTRSPGPTIDGTFEVLP